LLIGFTVLLVAARKRLKVIIGNASERTREQKMKKMKKEVMDALGRANFERTRIGLHVTFSQ
jgi:septum formation topological specificity factor MinE